MTQRKDFKRLVRDRARHTGESYTSALRTIRNARQAGPAATSLPERHHREVPVSVRVIRTIPDVRSTNIDKTVRFYTGLLGLEAVKHDDVIAGFASATHPDVEITLNHGAYALPPGFIVEVATATDVHIVSERALDADARIVAGLTADGGRFSMLDPSGNCVTIAARNMRARRVRGRRNGALITCAPAGVTTNDLDASRAFYVDVVGLQPRWEAGGRLMMQAGVDGGPALIVNSATASDHANGGSGLDINVGSVSRVDEIHDAATGAWIVLYEPNNIDAVGIRSFALLDPSGTAVNIYATLDDWDPKGRR